VLLLPYNDFIHTETFRIPFPTPGTKCPETKLEIKMTDKITLELTIEELKLLDKYVEYGEETKELFDKVKQAYPQPKMEYQQSGTVDKVEYNGHTYLRIDYDNDSWFGGVWWKQTIERHKCPMNIVTDDETRNILEGLWFNQVKKGVIDEPEHYDEVEWDEKDNPKPMDDVVNRLIEKHKSQKLWNILSNKYDYISATCDDIVSAVEEWLPEPQSAEGSQNVDTELLVDGFNDCVRKMKEMLR
jgi:hypothetical protein